MTKIAFISDTHGMHGVLTQHLIPHDVDVLVHCGDFTRVGKRSEVGDFADWCAMLLRKEYVKNIVVIAGNHDLLFDRTHRASIADPGGREWCVERLKSAGVHYLEDSRIAVAGLLFRGVPWTNRFFDWAFQIDSEEQERALFHPPNGSCDYECHVLVTHGPPYNILDTAPGDRHVGSRILARAILAYDRPGEEWPPHSTIGSPRPWIVACGHIHEGYGIAQVGDTLIVNASTCTGDYRPTNPPIVIDFRMGDPDPLS